MNSNCGTRALDLSQIAHNYFKCCCCNLHISAEHLIGSPYSRLFTMASWVLMLMSTNTCLDFWSFRTSEVVSLISISPESMALRPWQFFLYYNISTTRMIVMKLPGAHLSCGPKRTDFNNFIVWPISYSHHRAIHFHLCNIICSLLTKEPYLWHSEIPSFHSQYHLKQCNTCIFTHTLTHG